MVTLITRITNLEADNKELRESPATKEDALRGEIADVQQSVFDQIPTLKDGQRLLIETSDDKGQTVYAEVKTEQIIQTEAEQ